MLPFFLRSLSRRRTTVHHHHHQQQEEDPEIKKVDDNDDNNSSWSKKDNNICLTVWRKSLVFNCSGFTVIGPDGSLAYRVDNYSPRPHHLLLMDGLGNPIFTICRPKSKLMKVSSDWAVYEGEVACSRRQRQLLPVLCARKNMMRRGGNVAAAAAAAYVDDDKGCCRYVVEGSYSRRSCKILDASRRAVVGEIKKKNKKNTNHGASAAESFGLEVFELVVTQDFDSKFAMAVVLLLDQM
ncbi:protein LURP-one-related 8-like [Andrographis paniculata]|uniref:protein LURP-one-related 8-like n=1 Tax=Andrographis paniculata TaxID=175694 RepID=UPI0021E6F0A1|nr:protein LURP-one-related 8-like [Andrographis paniculata]